MTNIWKAKICNTCDVEQPLENFSKNKNRRDGRSALCRFCEREIGDTIAESIRNTPKEKKKTSIKTDILASRIRLMQKTLSELPVTRYRSHIATEFLGCNYDTLCKHISGICIERWGLPLAEVIIYANVVLQTRKPLSEVCNEEELREVCYYMNLVIHIKPLRKSC